MNPRHLKNVLLLSGLTVALAACGSDDGDTTPDPNDTAEVGGDVDAGAEETGPDVTPDDGPEEVGEDTTDAAPEVDAEDDAPALQCDPPRRAVGDRCRELNDRVCFDNTHCRDTEECIFGTLPGGETEAIGTCIYQIPDPQLCPGSEGCESNAGASLRAGFGKAVVTPTGWEFGRPGHFEEPDGYGNYRKFSGDVTDPETFCDCGLDMICPPGEEYAECTFSRGEYTGPDADGTEGDGYMQGAWIAGFGSDRNAQLCLDEWLGEDCEAGLLCCVSRTAHDDMWARTVVIEQGDTRVAMVSIDAVGFFYSDVQKIIAELDPALGIDRIVSTATHTHEAPDTMGRWGPSVYANGLPTDTGVVPEHMRVIYDGVIASIEEAVAGLEETDIYIGKANTGYDGFSIHDSRHPYIFNDLMMIMHFVRQGGDRTNADDTLGVLYNWHNHPETLGSENMYISSDFAHYVREYLENGFADEVTDDDGVVHPAYEGLGGIAVYVSGSVGGLLNPLSTPSISRDGTVHSENDYFKADALGQQLAELGFEVLNTPCTDDGVLHGCSTFIEDETFSFAFTEYMLPLENTQFQAAGLTLGLLPREIYDYRYADDSIGKVPNVLTATAQFRIGNVAFQTFPGEMFTELILGGYSPDNVRENIIVGNWRDVNCDETLRVRLAAEVEPRFPCLLNPSYEEELWPDLDAAPTDNFVRDMMPSDYLFIVGLGLDSLGYIVPTYDFAAGFFYLSEAPGDHYEETVSVGDVYHITYAAIETVNSLLGAAE